MTIVANNSITVSNVNDGTITHTAWSYSADGMEGFTTVYPNLNLGDNTKTFVGAEGGNNLSGSIRIDPATQKTQDGDINYLTYKPTRDNSDWFRFFLIPDTLSPNMTKVAVKPNTKYTFSVLLKGTGQHTIYAYQNWTAPNMPWSFGINLTNDWKLYTFTVTSSNVIPDRNVQFFIRSNNGTEINLKYPKVEEGSIATPYMPSSSEVTVNDYPSYRGEYSDFSSTASTDPSKYSWSIIRGDASYYHTAYSLSADGSDRFTTVYPNLNLLDGTKDFSGAWEYLSVVVNDGFYKELLVKSQSVKSTGVLKRLIATRDGDYTFSAYVSSTDGQNPSFIIGKNKVLQGSIGLSNTSFDWIRVTYTLKGVKIGDELTGRIEKTSTLAGKVSVAGHKWEFGSTATLHMPSASEVKTSDYPSYIGTYSDTNVDGSTDPSKYTWAVFKGSDGIAGANAPTITNIQDQIYLSTSNTVQSGGSWGILIPTWSSGKYYWSRVATTFSDGMTTYSTPFLDEALNQAGANQIKVTQLTQDLDGFKTTVSNTYLSKSDASGTYADKNSVTSQINQSATAVTSNVQTWTNNKLTSYSTTQQTTDSITSAVANKADKSQITQLSDSINLKVSKGDVVSQINVEAGQILFNSNKLVLNANTTEITGDAFIGGDMIVDGSIKAEKIVTNNLSAISSSLGDITGGSYTSWFVDMDPGGNPILNGIYLYNGRLRSVSITNPISTDPKEVGGIVNSSISGMEMFGGYTDYYYGEYNLVNSTAEDMIKGINGISFWSQHSDTGAYIGRIVGFQLPDKDPYLLISAPRLLVNGNVEVGGNIEASGDVAVAREHHMTIPIGWGLQMNITRIGPLVIANVYRQIINMTTTGENILMNERIPVGYRPHQNHAFSVSRNIGASIAAMAAYDLGSDGTIRITSSSGTFLYQGSTTWYTRDAIVD